MTELLIINGERVAASDGGTFDSINPSTGDVLATVAKATKADIDRAVDTAHAAFEGKAWGGMAPAERGRIMQRIAQALRDRVEELAELESRDNGKPLRQARTDVQVAARYFEFFAGIADKIMGNTIPLGPGYLDYTIREPIGVSAHIVPWNYPIQIGARGVAPALAAGCVVVLKPSSESPMTALRLGEIGLACGLPPGVLNIVPGTGSEAGVALASHPRINQLTFTGSVDVGVAVAKMAAENVVPVVMELGGKSPNIVFADADMDLAAQGVATAIFQNAGQTCSAGSRLLVERKAHGALVDRLAARANGMRVGPGVSDPDMGPIISKRQLETIERYVQVGTAEGAQIAAGGSRPTDATLGRGFYFRPTLLELVSPGMRVAQEEIFGPVLAIIDFDDLDEAATIANRSEYGLVSGIWTRDINKAMSLASRIKAGQVYINTYGAGGGVELPFGGYKKSGYGREKGLESLASYTQVKNVCIKFSHDADKDVKGVKDVKSVNGVVGFIGLGNMGRPMASNLVRKGSSVIVCDVNAEPVAVLAALGAKSGSVADVAAVSDVVFTMLPTTAIVEQVIASADGVLAHMKPGGVIVDMSTVDPMATDRLAAAARAKGVGFADAPVGRLASHAERGESLFMVGADADLFARIKPLLEMMGTTIHHCGRAGTGMRTKLVNNYLAIISCQLNAEAVALSQRFGLSLEKTLDVIHGTTATNGQLKIAWPTKVLKGDVAPGFTIDLAHKDLTLIVEAANAVKVPVPIAAVAREAFSAARASGHGAQDFSAMVDVLCDAAGIERARLQ